MDRYHLQSVLIVEYATMMQTMRRDSMPADYWAENSFAVLETNYFAAIETNIKKVFLMRETKRELKFQWKMPLTYALHHWTLSDLIGQL